jgi:hypothetical protein
VTKSTTIIRAVRDGEVCRLIQPLSATGLPKCLQCLKPVPKSYRESWKGKPAWFCTDACAISWANETAAEVWVKPSAVPPPAEGER